MANYIIIGGDGKEYGPVAGGAIAPVDCGRPRSRQHAGAGRRRHRMEIAVRNSGTCRRVKKRRRRRRCRRSAAPAAPAKTSGMAVTSLVLGILGMFTCGITALAGLILGIVAMVKVKNSGGRLGGGGLALAGTIVSGIFLLMIPIFAAMLLPALASAKQKAQEINCVNNEKQLALAVKIYSNDNNNQFPPAATWCDAIKTAVGNENIFKCPAADSDRRCDYAFNAKLDGMDESKINPQTVMIFESDGGWNANGGRN